ncbi:acyltransferase family protein [Streptomyces sp. NPDC004609]|uniref:acyltransferase family protein n=1 Tax=Streptomyces sp. NPDC004609 TaxID=3364704 RepID=UPI0036AE8786
MSQARTETPGATPPDRRPELDAIRLLVVVGLVFFHAALVFDERDDFYVKNDETTGLTMIGAGLGVVWAMPALFLIAGLGTWYSLRRRGTGGFLKERLLRLGVPLVFTTLTMMPVPQWLRLRAADPSYDESYLRFLPRFYDVRFDPASFPFVVQGEHFETGHLWFVVLLLAFSVLLALPVYAFRGGGAARLRARAAEAVTRRGVVLLPALPIALISAVLGLEESYGGWSRWAYLLFFVCGFALAADDRFRAAMRREAPLAAGIGGVLFLAALPGFLTQDDPFTAMTPLAVTARTLFGLTGWLWLVAILGLLDRRLLARRSSPAPASPPAGERSGRRRVYAYLAAAVLPFYVLHQPVVVAVAYGVVGWDWPMLPKYLVIVAFSLILTTAAYELLVRRTRVTRFLFGMRG